MAIVPLKVAADKFNYNSGVRVCQISKRTEK